MTKFPLFFHYCYYLYILVDVLQTPSLFLPTNYVADTDAMRSFQTASNFLAAPFCIHASSSFFK